MIPYGFVDYFPFCKIRFVQKTPVGKVTAAAEVEQDGSVHSLVSPSASAANACCKTDVQQLIALMELLT